MTIEPDDAGQGFESALRQGLGRRAGGPVAPGDLGDLSGRIAASARRRQRLMALAAVVALIAGATGGYVISKSTAATAGGTSASRAASFAPGVAGSSVATTTPGRPGAAAAMAPCPGSGLPASSGVGSATHLFNRTTADGITIRVYRNAAVSACGPLSANGGTTSSGSASSGSASTGSAQVLCTTGPSVSFGFSDDTAVGQGSLSSSEVFNPAASGVSSGSVSSATTTTTPVTTTAPPTTTTAPTTTTTTTPSTPPTPPVTTPTTAPGTVGIGAPASGAFGVVEGDPVWWVALQITSGDVASAVAIFSDGSTDQMAPIDGVVVLAHHVAAATAAAGTGPYVVEAKVQLLDASGATLLTVTFPVAAPTPVPSPTPVPLLPGAVSPPASVGSSAGSGPQKRSSTLPGAQAATGSAGGQVVIACPDVVAPGLP